MMPQIGLSSTALNTNVSGCCLVKPKVDRFGFRRVQSRQHRGVKNVAPGEIVSLER
jgi:hypothetical protein